MKLTAPALTAALLSSALILSGCAVETGAETDRLSIVASTDVYASIASVIAGDRADVAAIIESSAVDPHSYEATVRDRLALTRADVVIYNGGGYDPFAGDMLDDDPAQSVIVAVGVWESADGRSDSDDHGTDDPKDEDHSDNDGHDHADGVNEHVWYDFVTVKSLAAVLASVLTDRDPEGATVYAANLATFSTSMNALIERANGIGEKLAQADVVLTEPAPQYLVELVGAHNVTPAAFINAVEAGFDVPASTLLEVLRLVEQRLVSLVVWNEQTSGPQLERVVDAARSAGVAVVSVTETLPSGLDYIGWMTANLDALEGALSP